MSTTKTAIQWTDKTWNPVRGCSRVSPGCDGCYAMGQAHRFSGPGRPFEGLTTLRKGKVDWTGVARFIPGALAEPLSWRKPQRVFVNSMSDLFHHSVTNEEIAAVFGVMAACPHLTFQVLTKRAERMREWFEWISVTGKSFERLVGQKCPPSSSVEASACIFTANVNAQIIREAVVLRAYEHSPWPLPNVWAGVSCEDQERADERIPHLLATPAVIRFVSAEPLLGPIDLSKVGLRRTDSGIGMQSWEKMDALNGARFTQTWGGPWIWNGLRGPRINWVIVGGESGPGARPCDEHWIETIVGQCRASDAACFVKQLGARPLIRLGDEDADTVPIQLADRKGGNMDEWPEALRVREFPEVRT